MRYLGGILELPSFWSKTQATRDHQIIAGKLFAKVRQLVKDVDVESPTCVTTVALKEVRADMQGIDILACALLSGTRNWYQKPGFRFSGPLLGEYKLLVESLRQYVLRGLI
jgi:hypothetical protein